MDVREAEQCLREYYLHYLDVFETGLQKCQASLQHVLASQSDFHVAEVTGRIKDMESAVNKLHRKYASRIAALSTAADVLALMTDIIGLRVVCYYEDHVVPIGALIERTYGAVGKTDKIREANDGERFGYRALHLDLHLDPASPGPIDCSEMSGMTVEVQIRSIIQHAWSTLDHSVKYKKNLPMKLGRRVVRLAALAELMDAEFMDIRDEIASAGAPQAEDQDLVADVVSFARLLQQHTLAARLPAHRIDALFDDIARSGHVIGRDFVNVVLRRDGALDSLRARIERSGLTLTDTAMIRAALMCADPQYGFLVDPETRTALAAIRRAGRDLGNA